MNRLAAFSFAVLLGSLTAGAQSPAQQGSAGLPTVYVLPTPANPDCPVAMRARHEAGGSMRYTQSGRTSAPPSGIAQRIRLSLGNAKSPVGVTGARVTVRGASAKWRTDPAAQSIQLLQSMQPTDRPDLKKTLDITFHPDSPASVEENEGLSSEMVLSGFTSVQSITLDSLTYADGSIWTPQTGRACRVVPDPLMLVDGRY